MMRKIATYMLWVFLILTIIGIVYWIWSTYQEMIEST
jgi:hypothetical protein